MSYLFHKYDPTQDKDGAGPIRPEDLPEPTNNFRGWLCWVVKWLELLKCKIEHCCSVACQAYELASQTVEETCKVFEATSNDIATDLNTSDLALKWDTVVVGCSAEYSQPANKSIVKLTNANGGGAGAQYQLYCSIPFTGTATGIALSLEVKVNGAVTTGKAYSPATTAIGKPETVSLSKVIDGAGLIDGSQVQAVVNGIGGAGTANVVAGQAIFYLIRIK